MSTSNGSEFLSGVIKYLKRDGVTSPDMLPEILTDKHAENSAVTVDRDGT